MQVNESSLRAAVAEYLELVDRKQTHIHLRIGGDGLAYVDEDTGYCVSEAEFNRRPGHTITVRHQQGHGQFNLPDDWQDTDDAQEGIQGLVDAILEDLERAELQ